MTLKAGLNGKHRVIEAPVDLEFYILVLEGQVFFAGYAYTKATGAVPIDSRNIDDAWMIETLEQAVVMTKEDPRLKDFVPKKIQMAKRKLLTLPNVSKG